MGPSRRNGGMDGTDNGNIVKGIGVQGACEVTASSNGKIGLHI